MCRAVSSALQVLTAVFGMGTGVTLGEKPRRRVRRVEKGFGEAPKALVGIGSAIQGVHHSSLGLCPVWPGSLDVFSYRKSLLELHFM